MWKCSFCGLGMTRGYICDSRPTELSGDVSVMFCGNGVRNNVSVFLSACGAAYTEDHGTILSPGYPQNYENNLLCNYTIVHDSQTFVNLYFDPSHYGMEGQHEKHKANLTAPRQPNQTIVPMATTPAIGIPTITPPSFSFPTMVFPTMGPPLTVGSTPSSSMGNTSRSTPSFSFLRTTMSPASRFREHVMNATRHLDLQHFEDGNDFSST